MTYELNYLSWLLWFGLFTLIKQFVTSTAMRLHHKPSAPSMECSKPKKKKINKIVCRQSLIININSVVLKRLPQILASKIQCSSNGSSVRF